MLLFEFALGHFLIAFGTLDNHKLAFFSVSFHLHPKHFGFAPRIDTNHFLVCTFLAYVILVLLVLDNLLTRRCIIAPDLQIVNQIGYTSCAPKCFDRARLSALHARIVFVFHKPLCPTLFARRVLFCTLHGRVHDLETNPTRAHV